MQLVMTLFVGVFAILSNIFVPIFTACLFALSLEGAIISFVIFTDTEDEIGKEGSEWFFPLFFLTLLFGIITS